ncbi:MAG: hypothetical protein R2780_13885 [Crocinitomicaceae bacterium]
MHSITDEQIDFILDDITKKGIITEDVKYNILDHVCCIIENEMPVGGNFYEFYKNTIARFYEKELREIEEETRQLITFKYYYAMKRTLKIAGIVSVVLILMGSILKAQHLPGAGISLVAGFSFFSLIFIPLLIITKFRDDKAKKNRLVVTLGMLLTLTGTLGLMFKVMHWPWANYLFVTSLAIFGLIFIPVYFFSRYKDPELKFNTAINTVFMIAAAGMIFMLTNLKSSKAFDESVEAMEEFQVENAKQIKSSNEKLYNEITSNTSEVVEIKEITGQLSGILNGIKNRLIAKSEGISEEDARSISVSEISHPNDFKVVQMHFVQSKDEYSLDGLNSAVQKYNEGIADLQQPEVLRKINIEGLKMNHANLSVILNELTDIEVQVLSNENSYLSLQKGLLAAK